MTRLRGLLGSVFGWRSREAGAPQALKTHLEPVASDGPVKVLLVTSCTQDYEYMRSISQGTRWDIVCAENSANALRMLQAQVIPIVICDRDLPGGPWQRQVQNILGESRRVCVLLASRVQDSYLWDELIQQGGFDVIRKPLEATEVLDALSFALAHWRHAWGQKNAGEKRVRA